PILTAVWQMVLARLNAAAIGFCRIAYFRFRHPSICQFSVVQYVPYSSHITVPLCSLCGSSLRCLALVAGIKHRGNNEDTTQRIWPRRATDEVSGWNLCPV